MITGLAIEGAGDAMTNLRKGESITSLKQCAIIHDQYGMEELTSNAEE